MHFNLVVKGQNFSELVRRQVLVDWQHLKEVGLCLHVLLFDLLQHLAVVVAGQDRQLAGAGRRDSRCPLIIAKQCLFTESLALRKLAGLGEPLDCLELPYRRQISLFNLCEVKQFFVVVDVLGLQPHDLSVRPLLLFFVNVGVADSHHGPLLLRHLHPFLQLQL